MPPSTESHPPSPQLNGNKGHSTKPNDQPHGNILGECPFARRPAISHSPTVQANGHSLVHSPKLNAFSAAIPPKQGYSFLQKNKTSTHVCTSSQHPQLNGEEAIHPSQISFGQPYTILAERSFSHRQSEWALIRPFAQAE